MFGIFLSDGRGFSLLNPIIHGWFFGLGVGNHDLHYARTVLDLFLIIQPRLHAFVAVKDVVSVAINNEDEEINNFLIADVAEWFGKQF